MDGSFLDSLDLEVSVVGMVDLLLRFYDPDPAFAERAAIDLLEGGEGVEQIFLQLLGVLDFNQELRLVFDHSNRTWPLGVTEAAFILHTRWPVLGARSTSLVRLLSGLRARSAIACSRPGTVAYRLILQASVGAPTSAACLDGCAVLAGHGNRDAPYAIPHDG
jgi:hypothetical protein